MVDDEQLGPLLDHPGAGAPRDVLGSGTVGTGCILELSATHGAEARPYLVPGDRVRLEVELLGAVEARIVAGLPVRPLR